MPRPLPSLLALLAAAPLAAQPPSAPRRPPSDSVPRELVQALLPNSDGLRVGEPAGDLAPEVLPPNGIVLGSVEYGGTSTTLVVLMQPEHEAIAAYEARARAAGWAPPSPAVVRPSAETNQRGFVPSGFGIELRASIGPMGSAAVTSGMGRGTTRATVATPLCRANVMLMATSAPWSGGRTLLRLQSMSAAEYSPCRPRMPEAQSELLVRHVTVYDSIIPALEPPARAAVRTSGGGGSSDSWEMRADIETSATAADLLAHYAAEMERAGWSAVGEPAALSAAAVQVWRKSDTRGRTWHATLSFTGRPDARQYRGWLRLERDGAP